MALLFAHLEHQIRRTANSVGRAITQRWYGFDNYEQGDYLAADALADIEAEQEAWEPHEKDGDCCTYHQPTSFEAEVADPRATPCDTTWCSEHHGIYAHCRQLHSPKIDWDMSGVGHAPPGGSSTTVLIKECDECLYCGHWRRSHSRPYSGACGMFIEPEAAADEIPLPPVGSEESDKLKGLTWASLKAALSGICACNHWLHPGNVCAACGCTEARLKTSAAPPAPAENDPAAGDPPAPAVGSPCCCYQPNVVQPCGPCRLGDDHACKYLQYPSPTTDQSARQPSVGGEGPSADSDIPPSPVEGHPTVPAGVSTSEAVPPAGLSSHPLVTGNTPTPVRSANPVESGAGVGPTWVDWATPAICEVLAEHRVVNNRAIDSAIYCCDEDGAIHDEFGTLWEWREHVAPLIAERLDTAWRATQLRNPSK